mmetsp:Transcript_27799/g.89233  ORF Transcript_27799/g.89233 Transcript_27799/m.89233 type:complete len:309 (-) Transcript_27799:22-948(-)
MCMAATLASLALLPRSTRVPSSLAASAIAASLAEPAIAVEAASESSVEEAAVFFVEAFWVSTNGGDCSGGALRLSRKERRLLEAQMADDFRTRYGCSWRVGSQLWQGEGLLPSRLLLARGNAGEVIGCVGIEAALLDPIARRVLPTRSAEARLQTELAALTLHPNEQARWERLSELYETRQHGLRPLVSELLPACTAAALLTDLAVSPAWRRRGVARHLCGHGERLCSDWGLPGLALKVEEANGAARRLYGSMGYEEVFRRDDEMATRVAQLPAETRADTARTLLRNVPSSVLTLAKRAEERKKGINK